MLALEQRGDPFENVPAPPSQIAKSPQQRHSPFHQRQGFVGDQQIQIEIVALRQAVAFGAHPLRTVKAEKLWTGWLVTDAAMRAGVARAEQTIRWSSACIVRSIACRRSFALFRFLFFWSLRINLTTA